MAAAYADLGRALRAFVACRRKARVKRPKVPQPVDTRSPWQRHPKALR